MKKLLKPLCLFLALPFLMLLSSCGSKTPKSMEGTIYKSNIYKANPHLRPFHAALDILDQEPKTVTNLKTAVKNLGESLLIKPDFWQAYLNLGMVYEMLRNYDQAESSYKSALSLSKSNLDAVKGIVRVYFEKDKAGSALDFVSSRLQADSENTNLLNLKAMALSKMKKYSEALVVIQKIMEMDKSNIEAINNLGNIYYAVKRYNLAEFTLQNGIKIKKESALLHNNLGLVYLETKEMQSAIYEFNKAREYDPKLVEPVLNLANLYLKYQNYDGAIKEYVQILHVDPLNPVARANYSLCLMAQGNYQTAARFLKSASSIDPKNSNVYYNLGLIYMDNLGDPALALQYFNKYTSLERSRLKPTDSVHGYISRLKKELAKPQKAKTEVPTEPKPKEALQNKQ